ncbi:unnamed protein product [Lepeophtheirus salmonis]|uniref:(salmon louse) hypothetical protein n=1 Tax=Lepeophtheirus salmonis TaxID=72036 RepID=A0A7R8CNJ1_LEPSM|nr:unnamed protein product [Lepeophtheirus salmonis]CAF2875601.1 unnamed protein product [Lepeophtheirus salmonis]
MASPLSNEAPTNDLQQSKCLEKYHQIDPTVSVVARMVFENHLYYELVGLSLYADAIPAVKKIIVETRITQEARKYQGVCDISEEAFDLILEENSDSDPEGEDGWRRVYTRKLADGYPEKNQGMRVVFDLTERLRGHNVTCDNFFTSYQLGQQLLKRKITMFGTVRKNKPELPPALLASKEREVFSSKFAFTPSTTLVSYLPKKNKNVVLLSTLHRDGSISDRDDRKPIIIMDYNRNKGGVDNLDMVIGAYSCRRMTARCPLAIFHNIIDISSYNAFVIWREINPTWMSHKRKKASAQIVKAFQSAGLPDRTDDQASTSTFKASNRKRCQFCAEKKDNKTNNTCFKCNKYICKGCSLSYCSSCAQ